MSYTIKQKREAVDRNELWVCFPNGCYVSSNQWRSAHPALLELSTAIYFIGPTPPRVLSELEGELLDALKELLIDMRLAQTNMRAAAKRDPAWEGCAEAIQPRVDAAIAAIQKAESTP